MSRIDELLELSYRSQDLGNLQDVLSEAVYIILSQQTRESIYRPLFASLRKAYPTWKSLLTVDERDLANLLRPAGFQKQRAEQILSLLLAIKEQNETSGFPNDADLTLEFLNDFNDYDAERFLLALPGIGKKSARCILSYSLGRETLAVDTHVNRIFQRMGLISSRNGKPRNDAIQELVPAKLRKRLHVNLIHHGRAICRKMTPSCDRCSLISFCETGQMREARHVGPKAVELFAGAGGMGFGFRSAGFRIAIAVEQDRNAAQSYRLNNPGSPVLEADIPAITAKQLRELFPASARPDVVMAGPPCQGYSAAGLRSPRDPKNYLYKHVINVARDLRARSVVIENVPGLRSVNGVSFLDTLKSSLSKHFETRVFLLRAIDYGVPQNRQRYFFIGTTKTLRLAPPRPTHRGDLVSTDDSLQITPRLEAVLKGIPSIDVGAEAEYFRDDQGGLWFNLSTMNHSAAVIAKIATIKPGKGPISYRRLHADFARTLVAGHRALPVHPHLHRTISVREAARIQGFPDDYIFCGKRSTQPLQVANAVPPALARAVALALTETLFQNMPIKFATQTRRRNK